MARCGAVVSPHIQVWTRVEARVKTEGWMFCLLCCLCGSWLVSLLVLSLPGFRKFSHYCPQCRRVQCLLNEIINFFSFKGLDWGGQACALQPPPRPHRPDQPPHCCHYISCGLFSLLLQNWKNNNENTTGYRLELGCIV